MTPEQENPEPNKTEFEQLQDGEQLSLVQEFLLFLVENKAWWMIPILLALLFIGLVAFFASTGAAPFIYTL